MLQLQKTGQDKNTEGDRFREMNKQEDLFCQACQRDGTDILANGYCETCNEYFCSVCLKFHQKMSISKGHVIKFGDEMPKVPILSDLCLELCELHKTEIVKFYCQRHNYVGCSYCMVHNHQLCKVQPVAEVSGGNYGNSREFEQIKQRLVLFAEHLVSSKQKTASYLINAQETKKKVTEEIKTFRAQLNSYLDTVEAEILAEVEHMNVKAVELHTQLQEQFESIEKEIKEFQSQLDQHSYQSNQLFVTAKRTQEWLLQHEKTIEEIASKTETNVYNFEPSTELKALKEKQTPFGTLVKMNEKNTENSSDMIGNITPDFVRKLNVQAITESDCWITGMSTISADKILLADSHNKSLKILDVTENKINSMFKPNGQPHDVTTISAEIAAATLSDAGEILFINTKNGLSKEYSLNVRKNCKGIDYQNDLIAVSFCKPPTVQILSMKGQILREINDPSEFQYPCNVAFSYDKTRLYVSDFSKNAVFELNLQQNLNVFMKFQNLARPSGLAVTKDGNVIVCCVCDDEHVSMIDSGTKQIQSLYTQHVQKPLSILICEDLNCMYICENKGKAYSNYMKMFHFK